MKHTWTEDTISGSVAKLLPQFLKCDLLHQSENWRHFERVPEETDKHSCEHSCEQSLKRNWKITVFKVWKITVFKV